ncbi:Dimer-Tnp-hAT dimerization containing protein [Pyrenophora tritici-repentis]|nr:Dimer-Tnp-hAT dimerization containing protein [Pyrenophora tritici-repentis]
MDDAIDGLINPSASINNTTDDDEFERWKRSEPRAEKGSNYANNPIKYWVELRDRYPNLSKLALDVLSIPASSCECERLFSELGDLLEPRRRAIKPQLLAATQCERKDLKFRRQRKALAEFNFKISKTIAAKHLYLIENKDTLYERLTTLKKHLAPSDATRQRDLIARYKALQTPPRSRKVEEWLRSWVEVTNMCISAEVPETIGSRAQEDFLVACRTIDPEYGTSGLRALIDLEDAGTAIPSVEDYVSKFTTYLKRLINTEHPRRPKTYANALGRKKLDAALAADNDLRDKINKALDKWRAKQQESGGSIAIDDGNRPTRPTANTKTPYEIVWKTKPKVQHMRPIGCRAYVLNRSLKRGDKLESRALIGHLVGYDSTNIFRIWLPTKDQVIRTRDVIFEPTKFYDGPQGYARESIIEEVIELLSFPEEFELDDIAIEDLLTSRQRRQQQPSHASALLESQIGGEEIEQDKEQYEGGLPTLEPSNLSLHND